jgi:hypothetical protein
MLNRYMAELIEKNNYEKFGTIEEQFTMVKLELGNLEKLNASLSKTPRGSAVTTEVPRRFTICDRFAAGKPCTAPRCEYPHAFPPGLSAADMEISRQRSIACLAAFGEPPETLVVVAGVAGEVVDVLIALRVRSMDPSLMLLRTHRMLGLCYCLLLYVMLINYRCLQRIFL